MTTYLELHASRIQAYLGRSTRLRHVRGASALVSSGFQELARSLTQQPRPGLTVADDAPTIDGKIVVCLDGMAPEAAADLLVAELRKMLPAVQLDASWAPAASWADLPPETERRHRTHLAVPPDLPLARRCDLCHIDPAIARHRIVDQTLRICADCALREEHQRGSTSMTEITGPLAEDFETLAASGPTIDRRKTNHLATVYADGNRIGASFRAAAEHGADRLALGRGLTDATIEAVRDAAVAVRDRAAELGADPDAPLIVPHIVGGDDVLVSVPAAYGFLFLRTYLDAFERRASEAARAAGLPDASLTASGGVCIAHVRHPFQEASETAEQLASEAKSTYRGARSALAWMDLTRESDRDRTPWTVDELIALSDQIDRLASTGESRLSGIRAVLREDGEGGVRREAERLGDLDLVDPFLDDDAPELESVLSMVRWWV